MRRIRKNIQVIPVDDQQGCELYDELSGEKYEFGIVEFYLIEQLQKAFSPEQIISGIRSRFNQEITNKDIDDFLALLDSWNLLENAQEDIGREPSRVVNNAQIPRDDKGSDTSLQDSMRQPNLWHLFNPQALFTYINSILTPVRKLIWLTPFVFTIGCIAVMYNLESFLADISVAVTRFGVLGRILFAAATVNLASQVMRGLVARYYGLLTPSMGIRLIFGLIPRFNVQIIPPDKQIPKSGRLWLNSISSIIRLLLFGLAIILWELTRFSGSFLSFIGIELALLSFISLLLVANPLWRGDGVNFLSVWLEIPNLKSRSKRAMIGLFRKPPDTIVRHTKHPIALGLFGLASLTFFVAFAGFISYQIFQTLEQKYQGAGVALFLALAAYVSWNIYRQNKAKKTAQRNTTVGVGREQPVANNDSTIDKKKSSPYSLNNTKRSGGRSYLKGIVFVALLILVMFLPYQYETGGVAEVFPIEKASVSPETNGIVDQIYVKSGQQVQAGDKLARMSYYRQQKDVEVTEANIKTKNFEIQHLLTTPSEDQVGLAKEILESAQLRLKYSSEELQRVTPLYNKGVITLSDYENAKKENDLNNQAVQEAKLSLDALLSQVNPNQVDALKSELQRLEHEVVFFRQELDNTFLRSPISGHIISDDLNYKIHTYMNPGTIFAEIENTSTVSIRVAIPESSVSVAKIGVVMNLKLWAYPNRVFTGKVDKIEPAAKQEQSQYGKVVYIRSYLDNPDGLLLSGLTGYAKIESEETFLILAFSKALVRFFKIEVWSWLP